MNKPRFSIRKYKKIVASVLLGFFVTSVNVAASNQKEIPVQYQYVSESELTSEQRNQIVAQLPEKVNSTTVYVVYRKNATLNLKPYVETGDSTLMYMGMIAFVVVGYQILKDKKKTKKVITSVLAITTFGTSFVIPVEAFSDLAQYNTTHLVLDNQPTGQISIPGYEFVGYLPTVQNIFVDKKEKEIAFEKMVEFDPQLPANQSQIVVAGKNGKEITEEHYYELNGEKVIFNHVVNREEPVNQVVKIGTKTVVENGITTQLATKVFDEVIEYDASLWADEMVILQEGIEGKEIVKQVNDGTIIEAKVLVEKQDKKIKRGTKPLLGIEKVTETQEVNFETEYLYDDSKYRDEEIIEVIGEKGLQEVIFTYQTFKGKKQGNPFVQINEIKPKVNQVVRVGTKEIEEQEVVTATKETPFSEKVVLDANRWEDEEFVSQEGQNLVEEITTTYKRIRGVVQANPSVTTKVITPLKDKIIIKGSKPIQGETVEKEEREISFETKYIYDNNKYVDEEIIEKNGKVGKKEIVTTYKTVKGIKQENPIVVENELEAKEDKLIRVGTKQRENQEVVKELKTTPYIEEVINDPQLWEDAEVIDYPGVNQVDEITTTYTVIGGVRQTNPTVEIKTLTPMEKRVIRKGTKPIHNQEVVKELKITPFEIEYTYDNTKFVDEEETIRVGQNCEYELVTTYQTVKGVRQGNPTVVENEIKPKINQIIRKGTLPRLHPTIQIVRLEEKVNAENRVLEIDDELALQALMVDTQVNNNGRTLQNMKYRLMKNNQEVISDALNAKITLDNLEYYQEYDLIVEAQYDENDVQKTISHNQKFKLIPPKKIEIKDVDRYELIKYENNIEKHITQLDSVPNDLGVYFVRVTSDRFKTILLPVEKITFEQDKYRVLANIPDLVENRNGYKDGHDFYIDAKKAVDQNVYSDFKTLLEAMQNNPSGTFIIGSTLNATDVTLAKGSESYFGNNDFKGTLIGEHNGTRYAIQDLKYPLFSKLINATVKNLNLLHADIKLDQSEVAILSKYSSETTIQNVSAHGNVQGITDVGGIIARSRLTKFENVAMKGSVKGTSTANINSDVGGIVGYMSGGSLNQAYADVYASIYGTQGSSRLGSLVGLAGESYAKITNSYAKGIVENTGTDGQVGGLIGSLWNSGSGKNLISEVNVINGNIIYGDNGHTNPNLTQVYAVNEKATGNPHNKVTLIESNEVTTKLNQLGMMKPADLVLDAQANEITYTDLKYRNAEMFTPFYLKDFIIYQGDKINDTDILNKKIVSITPLQDMAVITDSKDAKNINKILVHFKDGTIKYYDVTYKNDSKSYLAEFDVTDLGIVYTLDTIHSNISNMIAGIINEFKSVEYYSDSLAKKINAYSEQEVAQATNETVSEEQARKNIVLDKMRKLFLYDEFANVKANLEQILPKLMISDKMISGHTPVIQEKIKQKLIENKEYILIALTYLSRWYNIDFTTTNIKELVLYHQDFYGKDIETIDFLIQFGKLGYNDLRLRRNVETYKRVLASNTDKVTLFDYFGDLREKFTTLNASDWFKQTSKAYLKEAKPLSNDYMNVEIYDKMTRNRSPFKEMVLPLLTAQEGIYAISSMNTILFGMFDRYMDMNLKESNPAKYITEVERVKAMVDRTTIWHRDYYDYWYRIVDDVYKPRLERNLLSWDGYSTDRGWISYHNANQAVKDFFGPIEKLYNSNGAGAYANGTIVHFVADRALDQYGSSVFTHEMVHNNDGAVYFNGSGRRNRLGAEYFALGLLQAPNNFNHALIGINQIFDYSAQKDNTERVHAVHPNRYQNKEDLHEYFTRMFDVLYTLDYAEGEVLTNKTAAQQKKLMVQMFTYMNGHLPGNDRRELPDGVSFHSVHELIDNHVTTRRGFGLGTKDGYGIGTNGYYQIPMFDPAYATGENDDASAGDIMFRRMAFELLAYKGWEEGFLPYVSSKLYTQSSQAGYGNANMPDSFVIKTISNGQFTDMKQFKKAMFDRRYAVRDRLKPVVIRWRNQDVTIDSYEKIKTLIDAATNLDLVNSQPQHTRTLKRLIFNAYLRMTDDFRASIYKD